MKAITSFEHAPLGLVGHLRVAIEAWLDLPFDIPPVAHLAFFIGMTFCMRLAFPVAPAWQVLAGMLGFGAMIELVQGSLPGRIPSPEDFGLDTLGALAGLMLFSCVDRSPS